MLYEAIKKLVQYGIASGLTPASEKIYTTNQLLSLFHEDSYEDVPCDSSSLVLEDLLRKLLDEAVSRGIITDSITYRCLLYTSQYIVICQQRSPFHKRRDDTQCNKYDNYCEVQSITQKKVPAVEGILIVFPCLLYTSRCV